MSRERFACMIRRRPGELAQESLGVFAPLAPDMLDPIPLVRWDQCDGVAGRGRGVAVGVLG